MKTTKPNTYPITLCQGSDKSLPELFMSVVATYLLYFVPMMLCSLDIRKLIIYFRVGSASCSDGKRAQTLRTVHFGRTCASSEGSWSYRRLTETRCTRKSRDSSTVTGSTVCFTSQTRWYKRSPTLLCSQLIIRFDFSH